MSGQEFPTFITPAFSLVKNMDDFVDFRTEHRLSNGTGGGLLRFELCFIIGWMGDFRQVT